ncbi:MAG: hypothetical protein H7099_12110 [Gemmatimonadaceae bacterium]|nr:hypothetical protein [Gemmatimonadaceae bacterium]
MGVTCRAMMVAVAGVACSMALSATMSAQKASRTGAPEKGTWGGEVAVGDGQSASLLKFLSPQWAVVAGASISSYKSRFESGDVVLDDRFTLASLQVGARRYARTGLGVRPVVGGGLIVSGRTGNPNTYGVYGELGAVYFFNPHVSLGAIGTASVTRNNPVGSAFSASLARLIGAVYF